MRNGNVRRYIQLSDAELLNISRSKLISLARLQVQPIMPRRICKNNTEFLYHIRARSAGGTWYVPSIRIAWNIFYRYLYFVHHAFDLKITAFVLMNNHYHLLARTPKGNLPDVMAYFQREVSRELNRVALSENQSFGGPYQASLLDSNSYYLNAYKYVYRNPVEAGLCERVEEYKYSTLNGLLGFRHLSIPVEEDHILFNDIESTLEWLNMPYQNKDMRYVIRSGLRKKTFQVSKKFSSVFDAEPTVSRNLYF